MRSTAAKRERPITASAFQRFHHILAPVSSEETQHAEGFVLATPPRGYDPVQKPEGLCAQLGEAFFQELRLVIDRGRVRENAPAERV